MEKYKLSENIDSNKIFIVNRSEIEGRLDPIFYVERFDFEDTIKLSKIAKIKGGKRIPKGYDYSNEETSNLYLRVANMDENNDFKYSDFKFISDELYNRLKGYEVFDNELIISIAGTVGKTKVISNIPDKKKVILTENCAKIVISDNINSRYLNIVMQTPFLQKQISASYIQTTIPKLGIDKILELRIPNIPPIEKQLAIVKYYNKAYTQKQEKEAEAQRLLDSIDNYLLGELGIVLPNEEDLQVEPNNQYGYALNTENPLVKNGRLFLTGSRDIQDKRWDVFGIVNVNKKIEGGIYPNKKLKQLSFLNKGQSITSNKIIAGEYPVIAGGQTSPYRHNQYNYEGNIITVSASGAYSGYVWYHDYPIFASDCTVVFSKNEDELSTLFLSEILKLKQKEIYNLQQGAGQPHVYARDLEKLNIPLPPLKKQLEISNHISNIRKQAYSLIEEAKNVLETAKNEVEQMILG